MLSIAQFSCIKKNDSSVAQTVPTQVSVHSRKLNRSSPWETGTKQFFAQQFIRTGASRHRLSLFSASALIALVASTEKFPVHGRGRQSEGPGEGPWHRGLTCWFCGLEEAVEH